MSTLIVEYTQFMSLAEMKLLYMYQMIESDRRRAENSFLAFLKVPFNFVTFSQNDNLITTAAGSVSMQSLQSSLITSLGMHISEMEEPCHLECHN